MKYALGNMLNGAGGLNADGLSLDLQFAADKTLTARKGPTPVFTRGSGATQVGSTGLIEYAPENLILQSETFGTTWTQSGSSVSSNVAVAPDGNITADKVIENIGLANHGVDQSITFAAIPYALSFYAKKDERIWLRLFVGTLANAWFNVDNGTVGTVSAGFTASIVDVGNGWYRCSMAGTLSAVTAVSGARVVTGDGVTAYTGDGTSGIFIWGAQLERHTSARDYIPTTTAAVYGPRFDHDPLTLACKGLLIEESRTNLVVQSQVIAAPAWLIGNVTVANSGTGPSGVTAQEITETTSVGVHSIGNQGGSGGVNATPVVSGITYTGSIFIKKSTVDWVQLTFGNGGFGSVQYANFNIANGTVGNSAGLASGTSPRIEAFPNGWYRCSMSATATATINTLNVGVVFTDNTDSLTRVPAYLGSTANKFLASLAQVEAGPFPTSYIPTTTAALARSADVCSITGSAFSGFYNASEGSFATSQIFNAPVSSGAQVVFDVNDTTSLNRTRMVRLQTNGFASFRNSVGNVENVTISGSKAITTGLAAKLSACAKADDFALYFDGNLQGVDTVATMQASPTTLTIGDASAGAPRATINGTIASLRYFKKRLSDSKLQTLTT